MRTLLVLALAASVVAAPVPKEIKKKDDAALLEGRWVSVSVDSGGGHEPNTGYWIEVKDGRLSIGTTNAKAHTKEVPFTLDTAESPKHLDITPAGRHQPKVDLRD